ncbi:MAG: ABC transporter permease [Bryobacteraceae bacterium]|nr:ABC transporter permease [Bryobacteraceae bacterium]
MWFYQLLLWMCPRSFRDEYGREMEGVQARRWRAAKGLGKVFVWLEAVSDLVLTGLAAHADIFHKDARYVLRTAWRRPGFSLTVIGVTALGIAAATAVFSVADHVLVRALPFPESAQLVKLWEDQTALGFARNQVSPANFRDWQATSASFTSMAAYRGLSVNLAGMGEPERVEGASASASLFAALGVAPLLGRTMTADEDRPGAPGTVVLSYSFWQRRFGGDPAVVGQRLLFDGQPHVVIGVMPEYFSFPSRKTQIWTAMRFDAEDFADRQNNYLEVIARRKPDVSLARAREEMRAIGLRLAAEHPRELAKVNVAVIELRDELSLTAKRLLVILIGAALFVLLIAMTNLASLFLARSVARRAEFAVRLALGAGQPRLMRQLLTESLLLAVLGGILGTALSLAGVPLLSRLVPTGLPIAATPQADWRLLLFAVLATTLTAAGFGVIPAWRATRGALTERTRIGKLRGGLVVAQVAASIVLVCATGLLMRAMWKLEGVDPGFRTANTLTFRTSLPMPKYETTGRREDFYQRVLGEVRQLPGVRAAAVISFRPLGDFRGGMWQTIVPGREGPGFAGARFVTPGYFAAMGIPLRHGRDIAASDGPASQPVAIVSESFVQANWPGESGLGRTFAHQFRSPPYTIVGVARDVRFRGLGRVSEPQMYFAHAQMPDRAFVWFAPKDFMVSASVDPLTLLPAIRRIVAQADPVQPLSDIQTLTGLVEDETAARRTQIWVIGLFALVAFLLAAVGIHGLLSFAVAQRTQEIGLRRALGAQARQVAGLVFGEALTLSLLGSVAGIAAAYAVGKTMEGLLFGVSPADPWAMGAAAGLAVLMTVAGSLRPALRALGVDPAVALRSN